VARRLRRNKLEGLEVDDGGDDDEFLAKFIDKFQSQLKKWTVADMKA
jgi:hypothetical protein